MSKRGKTWNERNEAWRRCRRRPNELKLSDRGRQNKGGRTERRGAGLCSLERVVRLPAYRGASGTPERKDLDSGGGMTGAAAGEG